MVEIKKQDDVLKPQNHRFIEVSFKKNYIYGMVLQHKKILFHISTLNIFVKIKNKTLMLKR